MHKETGTQRSEEEEKKKTLQIFDLLSNFFVSKTAQQIIFLLLPTQILDCKADGRDTPARQYRALIVHEEMGLWGLGFRVHGLLKKDEIPIEILREASNEVLENVRPQTRCLSLRPSSWPSHSARRRRDPAKEVKNEGSTHVLPK